MKRINLLILMVLLSFSLLQATYVGRVYVKSQDGNQKSPFFTTQSRHVGLFFDEEIRIGNLKFTKIQNDPIAEMEHHRYSQYYKGLEVFGGQIIKHYKKSEMVGINGEYFRIYEVDTTPIISKEEAVEIFRIHLNEDHLSEMSEGSKLIIYPVSDGDYHLAYQIVLERNLELSMTGIVDAMTGEVLLRYSNIHYNNPTIGIGIGCHGDQYKLPTTFSNGVYFLKDEGKFRPVNQYTLDFRTFDDSIWYVAADQDNWWNYDKPLVNVHAFLGWVYDYYYLAHGRQGIDDKNLDIVAHVHLNSIFKKNDNGNNASWFNGQMFFGDPSSPPNWQTAAALDVIAHEFTHGVTQFSSGLINEGKSGNLNEAFSDIMGTAVEHFWQAEGSGFNKAEWLLGEDIFRIYDRNSFVRSLSNPNSNADPCHLLQKENWSSVYNNMTIYTHAFYLLGHGGTNNVSKIQVSGLGIDKAAKIFYRAWVHYLVPRSDFTLAANALLQSARDLYEPSSYEYAQTVRTLEAIGYTVY